MSEDKLVGYKLFRSGCNGWMFLGTNLNLNEVGNAIALELQYNNDEGLSAEECDVITIEPFEITQKEIDEMPEFQGW